MVELGIRSFTCYSRRRFITGFRGRGVTTFVYCTKGDANSQVLESERYYGAGSIILSKHGRCGFLNSRELR